MLVILWIVGGLVALAVLATVLVPLFIDEQALFDMAQEQIKANTGGEFIVEGGAELSFFPRFGLRLEDTSLDLPARSEYDPSIQASIAELDVGLSLLPLLSGNVDVGTIVIAGVTADITDAAALPPAPAPAPVMSDRQWEKRGEIIRQKRTRTATTTGRGQRGNRYRHFGRGRSDRGHYVSAAREKWRSAQYD